jgi:TonB family protein
MPKPLRWLLAIALSAALGPATAWARDTERPATPLARDEPDAGPPDAGPTIVPPALVHDSPAPYPPDAVKPRLAGEVQLRLTVDAQGEVAEVVLVQGAHPLLDASALEAARGLRFTPATVNGAPTPSTLGYVYRFEPPPEPKPEAARGVLTGTVRRRGRNLSIAGATLVATQGEQTLTGEADGESRFTVALPPGEWTVKVSSDGLEPLEKRETVTAGQKLEVIYFLDGPRGRYETVVTGARERTEVSRTDLTGEELRGIPGTFGGDPFRAILMLPGVSTPVSGLAFPIVRGASPASTGWYLDGVELPALFHFFLLSAVIHPEFIDGLSFYPSAYPATYGRFTGGIVDARSVAGRTDRPHGQISVDLVNANLFLEAPLHLGPETLAIAVAGRVSYLAGVLKVIDALKLFDTQASAGYWDYQARVEWKPSFLRGAFRAFVFGSSDEVNVTENGKSTRVLALTFHRLDLRWRGEAAGAQVDAAVTGGLDDAGAGDTTDLHTRELLGRVTATWKTPGLQLKLGADGEWKRLSSSTRSSVDLPDPNSPPFLFAPVTGGTAGLFAELTATIGPLTLVPGLRSDLYSASDTHFMVLEPRLSARLQVAEDTVLKAGGGLYHQGPTAYLELPFVDLVALQSGLQSSWHAVVGVEQRVAPLGLDVDVQAYWSEHLALRELELDDPDVLANPCAAQGTCVGNDPFRARVGRAVGVEVLVRRKLGEKLWGWVAYTYSRSTRQTPGLASYPELFDETHLLNAVLSYQLPARWRVGVGFHFNSGQPYDPHHIEMRDGLTSHQLGAYCGPVHADGSIPCWIPDTPRSARLPSFFRVDARVEKSWVFDWFTLTGYLDFLNASLQQEEIAKTYTFDASGAPVVQDTKVPIILPMLGLRADF